MVLLVGDDSFTCLNRREAPRDPERQRSTILSKWRLSKNAFQNPPILHQGVLSSYAILRETYARHFASLQAVRGVPLQPRQGHKAAHGAICDRFIPVAPTHDVNGRCGGMVLDGLFFIKNTIDPTFTFRRFALFLVCHVDHVVRGFAGPAP